MAEIVISEFITPEALALLEQHHSVHYDSTLWERDDDLAAVLRDARALIVRNKTQVGGGLIGAAARLEAVGRLGVGLDNIDVATCERRGIKVLPAHGANAAAVAEYVIGAALILLRGAFGATPRLTAGEWPREQLIGRQLEGKQLGLLGFGAIGQATAARARVFGMEIAAYDPGIPHDAPRWQTEARRMTFEELLETSDVLSLHLPLNEETRGALGGAALARMKPSAVLINTARGGIVDERALAAALRDGRLAGVALDVFETEPIDGGTGALFAGLENVLLTPHIAGVTEESNARVSDVTARNVLEVLASPDITA
ncbi:hydroxyacid dehydrogenase [Dichotomicrobium thermohalophilum]|uniref:(S)-sulfolactate dehydrogenase n=1 Tax=Dichotomicrobium thermohalophilum TaxID=933063 RepID=A0A397Q6K5_9HYPH|nr:hydroxyacid dehydrogenase [Dichotomicrobium thermohalophilum]RIA55167.1 (S)-sulfolactate dehydrogenase [Dichotomicrobium thermohalophilum]